MSLSHSKIDALGSGLRNADQLSRDDLELLDALLLQLVGPLASVASDLRDRVGLEPSTRIKVRQSIIEKLRRQPTMRLSQMQDLAGARVVKDMTRPEQDRIADEIERLHPQGERDDLRERPRFGYRAVHVVVRADGRFVEVQVRTRMQNVWAQALERLGDLWGRQVRYGEPPDLPNQRLPSRWGNPPTRAEFMEWLMEVSESFDMRERGVNLPPEMRARIRKASDFLDGLARGVDRGRIGP